MEEMITTESCTLCSCLCPERFAQMALAEQTDIVSDLSDEKLMKLYTMLEPLVAEARDIIRNRMRDRDIDKLSTIHGTMVLKESISYSMRIPELITALKDIECPEKARGRSLAIKAFIAELEKVPWGEGKAEELKGMSSIKTVKTLTYQRNEEEE